MNKEQHIVYLSLGTNLGDKFRNLQDALDEIALRVGTVEAVSSFIETEPLGFESENTFLNAVCCVETSLSPLELLDVTQQIERTLGRKRKTLVAGVYSDREIDVDILLYDDLQMDTPELTIPHPRMWQRSFVVEQLRELGITSPVGLSLR
jgi:2-amino-4-hydroxy-6-hydroxymethyldihydropteridine diphosphokinase